MCVCAFVCICAVFACFCLRVCLLVRALLLAIVRLFVRVLLSSRAFQPEFIGSPALQALSSMRLCQGPQSTRTTFGSTAQQQAGAWKIPLITNWIITLIAIPP